jgi:hypothetical protein
MNFNPRIEFSSFVMKSEPSPSSPVIPFNFVSALFGEGVAASSGNENELL